MPYYRRGAGRSRLMVPVRTRLLALVVLAAFAILGCALLLRSYAATTARGGEAESGQITGQAEVRNETNASGDKAVIFGANNNLSSANLDNPVKKEIAMQLVSSAENSSLDWKAQYGYIEWNVEGVADENRGYTAGIIGFCSGCGDMTPLVQYYTQLQPGNVLSKYVPALQEQERLGMGNVTQVGLGSAFEADWKTAAKDQKFLQAQDYERDRSYFTPAVNQAKADGLGALGQFIYYDAMVVHGPGEDSMSFGGIRTAAIRNAKPPAQGGNEVAYLNAFLDARVKVMQAEEAHSDVSRIEDAQRVFLRAGNLGLNPPLNWKVYGDEYSIKSYPVL